MGSLAQCKLCSWEEELKPVFNTQMPRSLSSTITKFCVIFCSKINSYDPISKSNCKIFAFFYYIPAWRRSLPTPQPIRTKIIDLMSQDWISGGVDQPQMFNIEFLKSKSFRLLLKIVRSVSRFCPVNQVCL